MRNSTLKQTFLLGALCLPLPAFAEEFLPQKVGMAIPISLTCPARDGDPVELIYRTHSDLSTAKLRVFYSSATATQVVYASADHGQPMIEKSNILLSGASSEKSKDYARFMLSITDPVLTRICRGSAAAKTKFFAALAANKAQFPEP